MCSPPHSSPASVRGQDNTFGDKLLSAMRAGFGGHVGECRNNGAGRPRSPPGDPAPPATLVIFGGAGDLTRAPADSRRSST